MYIGSLMAEPHVVLPLREGRISEERGQPLPRLVDPTAPFTPGGNSSGPRVRIDTGDTLITIGAPAVRGTRTQDLPPEFDRNLALDMSENEAGRIGEEVIQGVQSDIQSRAEWIEQYTAGLDLLSVKAEKESGTGGQRREVSRVGHELLIESMVRGQAAAEGEMLPAAGPVKVPTVGRSSDDQEIRAKDFQDDFNYIMTDVITEYYPDTSSMLMHEFYCGLGYKKVYWDPIRNRPTSQSILAPDMIVSEEAADLASAVRVTHEIAMSRATLRRMQLLGQYLNVELGMPSGGIGLGRQAQRKILQIQGQNPVSPRPQDSPYLIWETDQDFEPGEWGIDGKYERTAPDGLPMPYKVAVEQSSHKVLGIWRNWRPEDKLYLKHNIYVKFSFIPSMGYHPWGFLHLLGNQTRALRAIRRILINAGMLNNFPGGLKAAQARTRTTEVAPGPGEWIDVEAVAGPNFDIRRLFMPMPYAPPNPALVQLSEIIKNDSMRLGATAQIEVGEGRSNVPVGTIMAMIEQQVQVMAGVHKRNHRAQKEELKLLRELFAADVKALNSFAQLRPRPGGGEPRQWAAASEFMDLDLQPASDPNVPAQVHRLMMGNVLVMLAQQAPQYFDVPEVLRAAVALIGADPDRFVTRPDANAQQQQPDPKVVEKTLEAQQKQAQTLVDAQKAETQAQVKREEIAADAATAAAQNETAREVAVLKEAGARDRAAMTAQPSAAPTVGLGG
jgi:hypothetical protein